MSELLQLLTLGALLYLILKADAMHSDFIRLVNWKMNGNFKTKEEIDSANKEQK